MQNLGYYNGNFDLIENMSVPMNDRACFFGDGLFEVAYARNRKIYALDEHMSRMYEISRGTEMRNHAPLSPLKANIWVTIREKRMLPPYEPMKLITAPDTRFFHCNMKTLNLLPTVIASIAANNVKADEAIFHRDGIVTECAHSNICIIRDDGAIQTAPADNLILPGVTRAHMIKSCAELGIPCIQKHFTLEELMNSAEVVVISSGTQFRPAYEVDGKAVGGRAPEIVKALQDKLYGDFLRKTDV